MMDNHEKITITMDLYLDEQCQKGLDVISQYWRELQMNDTYLFSDWTREQALSATIEQGLAHVIRKKAEELQAYSKS